MLRAAASMRIVAEAVCPWESLTEMVSVSGVLGAWKTPMLPWLSLRKLP
jgi:hypothetical protein